MTCRLCKGSGVVYGSPLSGTVCPACGGAGIARTGTGMACAAVSTPAEKTLLDEFAMAAPCRVFEEGHHGMASFASSAYCYAAAMMAERARRDEIGNIKEANT